MGWDAIAIVPGQETPHGEPLWACNYHPEARGYVFADDRYEAAFDAAASRAESAIGKLEVAETDRWVDGLLRHAGLDISDCGEALELATGSDCWTYEPWTPGRVRELARTAEWPETPTSASISAREFLETCAALGLAIEFNF